MASPADAPESYLTFAQALWAALVFAFGLGVGWATLKMDIARSKERHNGHDAKFKELDTKLETLAKSEQVDEMKSNMIEMKSDIIREVYALHGVDYDALPRVINRRREPR